MGENFRNRTYKTGGEGRTTRARKEKCRKVYDYLVSETKQGHEIPNLTTLSRTVFTDMHLTNLMEILYTLSVQGKIIYKRGKVLAVSVPKVNGVREREYKFMKNNDNINNVHVTTPVADRIIKENKQELAEEKNETEVQKFDKVVKEVIADYILKSNARTKDDMIKYIEAITNITDKIRKKLY